MNRKKRVAAWQYNGIPNIMGSVELPESFQIMKYPERRVISRV